MKHARSLLKLLAVVVITMLVSGCGSDTVTDTSATIVGHVYDTLGIPVAQASVSTTPTTSSVLTDANGYYIIKGLSAGSYSVTASHSTMGTATKLVSPSAKEVLVVDLRLSLPKDTSKSTITGRVINALGEFVKDATVTTVPATKSVTTDAVGNYVLQDIPVGTYKVNASSTEYGVGQSSATSKANSITVCDVNVSLPVSNEYAALKFDTTYGGTRGYVKVENSDDLNLWSGSFTLECWYNVAKFNVNTYGSWLLNKGLDNSANEYMLGFDSQQRLTFWSSVTGTLYCSTTGKAGAWNHVAVVIDSAQSSVTFYINGKMASTQTLTFKATLVTESPLFIGARNNLGSGIGTEIIGGVMDEVRIWKSARTSEQIALNYAKKLSGNEIGLVAYWNFSEQSGKTVFDQTKNGHNGAMINDVARVKGGAPIF